MADSIEKRAENHRVPVRFVTRAMVKSAFTGHERGVFCVKMSGITAEKIENTFFAHQTRKRSQKGFRKLCLGNWEQVI